jgi:hypothetical protein
MFAGAIDPNNLLEGLRLNKTDVEYPCGAHADKLNSPKPSIGGRAFRNSGQQTDRYEWVLSLSRRLFLEGVWSHQILGGPSLG